MTLTDKTAIVTGAADGIGFAIAKRFAAEGATVLLGDINEAKCEAAAKTLRDAGGKVMALACNVTNTGQVETMVNKAAEATGRLDILVNNAAVSLSGSIATMEEADWHRVLDTNLTSVFRTIKAALPYFLKQRSGSIINIASVQAYRPLTNFPAYAAAKGGVLALTRQVAAQFGKDNIRCNSVSPGTIATPMVDQVARDLGPTVTDGWSKMHALERIGRPEEVAAMVLFLASDESSFVTGHDLLVDGGLCTLPRYFMPES